MTRKSELQAGVARRIISPPPGIFLIGYGDRTKGNRGVHDDLTATALVDEAGERIGALLILNDVTRMRQLETMRKDFAANVSHELKTPLTSIRMMAEMLRDGMVPDGSRQHQYYETIAAESERLSRLVANVLELARLERGTRGVTLEKGDVAPVLAEVGDALGIRAVFVLSTRTRSGRMPRARAAMSPILALTPCPISTAPVLTETLPST